jgi:cupin 2 domain-containing protein
MRSESGNLFRDVPAKLPHELTQTLLAAGAEASSLRVERIVSRGHASPAGFWYDQPEHEWVLLVSGAARLRFEDEAEDVELKAGDYLNIPAHRRHCVEWTAPGVDTIWLAIHYV